MKKVYCQLCRRKHEDMNWRFQDDWGGWACSKWFKPKSYEFVPQRIKDQRVKHAVDIIQPYSRGEINPEFVKHYPAQSKKIFKNAV